MKPLCRSCRRFREERTECNGIRAVAKNGVEYTVQDANIAKGALKTGKALAGASKGAAFGPYGMAAGLAWEGRKVIAKAAIVFVALLLLPVMILTMLPSMLLGGVGSSDVTETIDTDVWDASIAEEILMHDAAVLTDNYAEACVAIDTVMRDAHTDMLADIRADFSRYGANDIKILHDPYTVSLPHDSTRILCEYSLLTDFAQAIKITDLTEKLTDVSDNFFFYTVWTEAKIRTSRVQNEDGTYTEIQTPYKEVNYTVHYAGNDYITDEVFGLTEEQKQLAADFADSLSLYLDGEQDDGTTE